MLKLQPMEVIEYDGGYYTGDMEDNQPHGNGMLVTNEYEYKGCFKNGKKHGKGECKWVTGEYYNGIFCENHFCKGLFISKKMNEYNGVYFRNNDFCGTVKSHDLQHCFYGIIVQNFTQMSGTFINHPNHIFRGTYINRKIINGNDNMGNTWVNGMMVTNIIKPFSVRVTQRTKKHSRKQKKPQISRLY